MKWRRKGIGYNDFGRLTIKAKGRAGREEEGEREGGRESGS